MPPNDEPGPCQRGNDEGDDPAGPGAKEDEGGGPEGGKSDVKRDLAPAGDNRADD